MKEEIGWMLILVVVIILSITYYNTRTLQYEGEITCNTGKVGIDFSERFVFNESSVDKDLISFNPQRFDLKGIEGVTCTAKFKGEFPLSELVRMMKNV